MHQARILPKRKGSRAHWSDSNAYKQAREDGLTFQAGRGVE